MIILLHITDKKAKKLIRLYVDGWKENDVKKIIRPLAEDCLIIESHGPTYKGIEDVKEWVASWVKEKYKVDKWEVGSFYFIDNTAIFEWIFEFSSDKEGKRMIEGITIAQFKNDKIAYLREYRTTEPRYFWRKKRRLNTY